MTMYRVQHTTRDHWSLGVWFDSPDEAQNFAADLEEAGYTVRIVQEGDETTPAEQDNNKETQR